MAKRKAKNFDSNCTKKSKNKRAEHIKLAESIPPLEYDPLDPSLNVLHRAGIAGLLLQIKAMDKLREQATDEWKEFFPKIDWSYIGEDDRGIKINFDINTFRAIIRERYLGILKSGNVKEEKLSTDETDEPNKPKKKEKNVEPYLSYLTALGAKEDLQTHVRGAYLGSFFQIYKERGGFFHHTERQEPNNYLQNRIDALWNAIANNHAVGIQKSSRPNIVGSDFKATQLREEGKKALLLHFWSLASAFFKPIALNISKDKKTKQLIIEDENRLAPAIVVPDVSNVRTFTGELISSYSRSFDNNISTPLEASLAFFLAPRIAHNAVITPDVFGARGATVFAYKRPLKNGKPDFQTQPLVGGVYDTPLDDALLQQYQSLRSLKFLPYRALRVKNLLAGRVWYYGFDALVDKYPLELFVPTQQQNGDWVLHPKARELAKDLVVDFYYFANKENKMDDEETNIPTLINEIVSTYLDWRVYNRGQNPPSKEEIKKVFGIKRTERTKSEQDVCDDFVKRRSDGRKKEFIDFRGATDQSSFAELFIARLFEAEQDTSPEQREMLRPFYEGSKWESGRWLVLMALSADSVRKSSQKYLSTSQSDDTNSDDTY